MLQCVGKCYNTWDNATMRGTMLQCAGQCYNARDNTSMRGRILQCAGEAQGEGGGRRRGKGVTQDQAGLYLTSKRSSACPHTVEEVRRPVAVKQGCPDHQMSAQIGERGRIQLHRFLFSFVVVEERKKISPCYRNLTLCMLPTLCLPLCLCIYPWLCLCLCILP